MSRDDDRRYMTLALGLASRGLGNVWPNPAVGCVLVKDGRIVGRGWTQPGGRPHAERRALAQAGDAARGATAYVTLEPCAHFGKTPPCAAGLIEAGVTRVVSAFEDPDARVSGRGHAMLRAAGIQVDVGVMQGEARALQSGFLARITQSRPWLALKLATSFDGRIALRNGESQWITSATARARVHALRSRFDAVMVGGGTARADDPLLTVRNFTPRQQPVRVVASAQLDLPRVRLAASVADAPLWIVHGPTAPAESCDYWSNLGAKLLAVDLEPTPPFSAFHKYPGGEPGTGEGAEPPQHLSPHSVMRALADQGLTRVFCEGGGQFGAALLRSGLVDELIGFTAGAVLGGDARAALGPLGVTRLADAPRYDLVSVDVVGGDLLHRWRRQIHA